MDWLLRLCLSSVTLFCLFLLCAEVDSTIPFSPKIFTPVTSMSRVILDPSPDHEFQEDRNHIFFSYCCIPIEKLGN